MLSRFSTELAKLNEVGRRSRPSITSGDELPSDRDSSSSSEARGSCRHFGTRGALQPVLSVCVSRGVRCGDLWTGKGWILTCRSFPSGAGFGEVDTPTHGASQREDSSVAPKDSKGTQSLTIGRGFRLRLFVAL